MMLSDGGGLDVMKAVNEAKNGTNTESDEIRIEKRMRREEKRRRSVSRREEGRGEEREKRRERVRKGRGEAGSDGKLESVDSTPFLVYGASLDNT